MEFFRSVADAVLDRPPAELIGALMAASAVAIVAAGLYALGRRKGLATPTFVGSLALVAGVSCMVLAAGYIEYEEGHRSAESGTPPRLPGWPNWDPGRMVPGKPWGAYPVGWSSGFHVVAAADRDRDGRITPEDAARLVREADADGDGSVDFHDIDRLIAGRLRTPAPLVGPPAPPRSRRGGEEAAGSRDGEAPPEGTTSHPDPDRAPAWSE